MSEAFPRAEFFAAKAGPTGPARGFEAQDCLSIPEDAHSNRKETRYE